MEINDEIVEGIIAHTTCNWTRGYLSALRDTDPSPKVVAKNLIEAEGPGRKIAAIKAIRARFGLGLKEGKALVDEFYISGKIIFPDEPGSAGVTT
jgi:hypothetical protein